MTWFVILAALAAVGCSDTESDGETASNGGAMTSNGEADAGDTSGAEDTGTTEMDTGTTEMDTEPEINPLEWALDESGPFNVGFRSWEVVYTSPADGEERSILLNLWYPTEATEGAPATYLGLAAFEDTQVYTDAPPAASVYDDGYPVLVHSHGHQGFGGVSANLMRHAASHGWIAVAPDHTDNTLSDTIEPKPTDLFIHRAKDITAVLDELDGLDSDDPLAGKARTARVVLTGHSFGVYTTWAAAGATPDVEGLRGHCAPGTDTEPFSNWEASCTEQELEAFAAGLGDSRIVGIVPMAGAYDRLFFGEEGWQNVDMPVLYMSGSEDNPDRVQENFNNLVEDAIWVNLEGGVHESFGLCGTLDPDGTGLCSSLPPADAYPLVNTYVLAFLRRHVLSDDTTMVDDILTGATVPEHVSFQTR